MEPSIFTLQNAQLSASFRAIINRQLLSDTHATVVLELLNYSQMQVLNRANHRLYFGKYDGYSNIISVFTRDDAEDFSYFLVNIRNRPRFPVEPVNLCRSLDEPHTAILGFGCNYATRMAYFAHGFPPPRLTLQLFYIQSLNDNNGELVTLLNIHPSFRLLDHLLQGPLYPSFSHLRWTDTNIIATRGAVPNVRGGTLFIFMKPEGQLDTGVGQLATLDGDYFEVSIRLSNAILERMLLLPNRLRTLAELKCLEPRISTQTYLDRMRESTLRIVMEHVIVGTKSSCFVRDELQGLCNILGLAINDMCALNLELPIILGHLGLLNVQALQDNA